MCLLSPKPNLLCLIQLQIDTVIFTIYSLILQINISNDNLKDVFCKTYFNSFFLSCCFGSLPLNLSCHVVTQLESHFGPLCFMSCCYCLECQCKTFQSTQHSSYRKQRVFYIFVRANLF